MFIFMIFVFYFNVVKKNTLESLNSFYSSLSFSYSHDNIFCTSIGTERRLCFFMRLEKFRDEIIGSDVSRLNTSAKE